MSYFVDEQLRPLCNDTRANLMMASLSSWSRGRVRRSVEIFHAPYAALGRLEDAARAGPVCEPTFARASANARARSAAVDSHKASFDSLLSRLCDAHQDEDFASCADSAMLGTSEHVCEWNSQVHIGPGATRRKLCDPTKSPIHRNAQRRLPS